MKKLTTFIGTVFNGAKSWVCIKRSFKVSSIVLILSSFFLYSSSLAQQTVKGTVKDSAGGSLPGVSIKIKGTDLATISDHNGNFNITVEKPDDILVFSFIGFAQKEIVVENKTNVTVVLEEVDSELSEVVVVGYGTQKKVNLTGSVSSVDGDDLAKRPVIRASAALQGLAAGVTVTQGSGQPGSDGGSIRIRGIGTLGNSEALVLIDGVEGSIDGVNPNDIESISILKDASSAAIYGSRAANGVILVTTKRGKSEDLKLTYNGYVGKQRFTELPEYLDGYDYMTMMNEAKANLGASPVFDPEYIADYQQYKTTNPDEYPDTDWQKELYTGSGLTQNHYLSFSGGKKVNVLASVGYQDQNGQIPNFNTKRYSFRMNTIAAIKENLQSTVLLSGRNSPVIYPTNQSNIKSSVNRTPPIYPARLSDGRWGVASNGYNPIAQATEGGLDRTNYNELRATFQLNYQPFKGFDLEGSFTPLYNGNDRKAFNKSIETFDPTVNTGPLYVQPVISSLVRSDMKSWQNTARLIAKYNTTIKKHDLAFLGGYEEISYKAESFDARREGFAFPEYQELDAGSSENWTNGGTTVAWGLISYFGRANYSFDNKYLFEGNIRFDGSSRFPPGKKYGVFPSFSAGWRVSEESFLKDITWLSDFKLRGSWGILGNQEIGNYPFSSVITLGRSYVLNGVGVDGAGQKDMVNENISWEESRTIDIGFDGLFFNNKIGVTFDYYNRKTTGILLRLPVTAMIGLTEPYQNAGIVGNKGWEVNLSYRNKIAEFNYQAGFNLSDVRNKVIDLKGAGPIISGYNLISEGYPINELYGYRSLGLFQTPEQVASSPTQIGVYGPGDIIYQDIDGSGTIGEEDRVPLGSDIPRYTYGLNFSAQFKNFDLSFLVQGVGKKDVLLNGDAVWALYNNGKMQTWQTDYWTPENTNAAYPRLIAESSHNNYQNTSFYMYSGAYARLKNLQIGFTLPDKIINKMSLSRLRVYVTGDNLFALNHMQKGWDPERPSGNATIYPVSSTLLFGLDLTF